MWRILAVLPLALIIWLVAKDPFGRALLSPGIDDPVVWTADYTDPTNWFIRPDAQPPGAWERPWGVDVFVILPTLDRGVAANSQSPEDANLETSSNLIAVLARLETIGSVYAPRYRMLPPAAFGPDADEDALESLNIAARTDVVSAFSSYLENDNRFRAILFVAIGETEQLLTPLSDKVQADPTLLSRTVGFVGLAVDERLKNVSFPTFDCMDGVGRPCFISHKYGEGYQGLTSLVLPTSPLSGLPGSAEILPDDLVTTLLERAAAASEWLDQNEPRPAPPLPDLTEVEVAPIRRPIENSDN